MTKNISLYQWMQEEGVGVNKLAAELGCDPSRISRIRRKLGRASPELAEKIVKRTKGKVSWESLMRLA